MVGNIQPDESLRKILIVLGFEENEQKQGLWSIPLAGRITGYVDFRPYKGIEGSQTIYSIKGGRRYAKNWDAGGFEKEEDMDKYPVMKQYKGLRDDYFQTGMLPKEILHAISFSTHQEGCSNSNKPTGNSVKVPPNADNAQSQPTQIQPTQKTDTPERVTLSIGRKYNLGNYYGSVDVFVSRSSEIQSTEKPVEAYNRIWNEIMEEFEKRKRFVEIERNAK